MIRRWMEMLRPTLFAPLLILPMLLAGCAVDDGYYAAGYPYGYYGYPGYYGYNDAFYGPGFGYFGVFGPVYRGYYGRSFGGYYGRGFYGRGFGYGRYAGGFGGYHGGYGRYGGGFYGGGGFHGGGGGFHGGGGHR